MHEGIEINTTEQRQPRDYVYIDTSHHSLYTALTALKERREGEKFSPFRQMTDVFMLAAFIGYRQEKFVPLGTNSTNIFLRTAFKDDDMSLLRALALAKTEKPEVLTNEREIQEIAEGYANGGITVIREQIEEAPGGRIENLVNLLLNWEPYKNLISPVP